MSSRLAEISRYGVNGVVLNVSLFAAYAGFVKLGLQPILVAAVLYPIGVMVSFLVHRRFTFRARTRLLPSGVRFIIAYAAGYGLNLTLLWAQIERLGIDPIVAQAVSIVVVAAFLYVAQKYWVFDASDEKTADAVDGSTPL